MSHKRSIPAGLLTSSSILMAFTPPTQGAGPLAIDWLLWLLIIIVVVAIAVLLIWWWMRGRPEEAPAPKPAAPPPTPAPPPPAAEPTPPVPSIVEEPPTPDDLKLIEGIGPKIASLLQGTGITTFAQLAAADVDRLKQILADAGLEHLADPTTWPEQARLAGAGDWDAFEALQEELKGGRRA